MPEAGVNAAGAGADVRPGARLPGVVLLGCPRSGTSLLGVLMERRFAFAAPVESHFVRYFDPLVRHLRPAAGEPLVRLARAVNCFLAYWVPVNNRVRRADTALAYSLASLGDRACRLARESDDFPDWVGRLFSAFAAERGRSGWVEQSVYATPGSLQHLDQYPPGTRFIHVVRDGRDVWLSWSRTWFAPASLGQGASWWCDHVTAASAWGESHASIFLEVRYEDLLAHPERVLRAVGEFLGREPLEEHCALNSGLADVLGEGGTHDRIRSAPDEANVGRWQREMDPVDQARFEKIAGNVLRRLGYPSSAPDSIAAGLSGRKESLIGRCGRVFSSNNIKRRLKYLLPWFCYLRRFRN